MRALEYVGSRQGRDYGAWRLLALCIAAFAATAVLLFFGSAPRQAEGASDSSFEYALPVNAAQLKDQGLLDKALDTARGAGVNSVSTGAVWW